MANKEPFEGKGFDRDPLTGDENASHREMFHKVRDAWPTVEGMDNLRRGGNTIVKIVAVCAAVGALTAFLVKQGVL